MLQKVMCPHCQKEIEMDVAITDIKKMEVGYQIRVKNPEKKDIEETKTETKSKSKKK